MESPDRLSLITYVSRLFDFFQEKEPVARVKTEPKEPAKKTGGGGDRYASARAKLRRVRGIGERTTSGRWLLEKTDETPSPATSKEPTPIPEPVKASSTIRKDVEIEKEIFDYRKRDLVPIVNYPRAKCAASVPNASTSWNG